MTTNTHIDIDRQTFIEALFPWEFLYSDERPILATAVQSGEDVVFPTVMYEARARSDATHTCISTFTPDADGCYHRRKAQLEAVWLLQLDDIGTKSAAPPLEPSVIIETKPGNYTYLYILEQPCTDIERFLTVTNSLKEAGFGDPNCADAMRLFRLPGSKPPGKEHEARVILWEPDRIFNLGTMLDEMQVAEVPYQMPGDASPVPAPAGVEVVDEVFEWLQENGHVYSEDNGGWWKIRCPWAEDYHSDHRDVAKYKPCDSTNLRRVFHCHHTHGQEAGEWGDAHGTEAFLEWVAEQGGPLARPIEYVGRELAELDGPGEDWPTDSPLRRVMQEDTEREQQRAEDEVLQGHAVLHDMIDRYVLYQPDNRAYDLASARPEALNSLSGLQSATIHMWPRDRHGRPINMIEQWLRSPEKKVTSLQPILDPRQEPGWTGTAINIYAPYQPTGGGNGGAGQPFIRLVQHAYPEDWEYALDWMAYKLQNPWQRMVALVNFTPTQGTGRSSIMSIFSTLIGNSYSLNADRLFGANSNQFNSFMNSLLITVGEVDNAADGYKPIKHSIYTKLKVMVDPSERWITIERKGMDPQTVECFASFMIATNAGGGLPLEDGDRRFVVCRGNRERLPHTFDGWLHQVKDLGDEAELDGIHAMLMARDVSHFMPTVAPMTDAKQDMIDDGKGPVDQAIEDIISAAPSEGVFTTNGLSELVHQKLRWMQVRDVHVQVEGWARKYSHKPEWANAQGKVRANGMEHRPRVLNASRRRLVIGRDGDSHRRVYRLGKEHLKAWLEYVADGWSDAGNVVNIAKRDGDG